MDRDRRVPGPLLEALRDAGAFALSTPRELRGHELPLADSLSVLEALGRLDASVAWTVWNGNLGFSAAMLPPTGVAAIWGDPSRDPIVANSARPSGSAKPVDGGFVLDGRWDIVSAIDVADWVALFAMLHGGAGPDVRVLYVPRSDVRVLDTWNVHAMRGTGSNTVVAEAVFVPAARVVSPFAPAHVDRPLYRVPAFTLASTGAAAVVIGVAAAAIDEAAALASAKRGDDGKPLADRAQTQAEIGRSHAALAAARAFLVESARAIDAAATERRPVDERLRATLRASMAHAGLVSRQVLASMYTLASSSALYDGQPIERMFRDGTAAAQHAILHASHLETYGRVCLGRPAGVPVL